VLLDLTLVALLLAVGNVAFRRFDPNKPLWRRLLKSLFTLAISAAISHYFGRTGILIAISIALLPLIVSVPSLPLDLFHYLSLKCPLLFWWAPDECV
jgi:hypothetical protein